MDKEIGMPNTLVYTPPVRDFSKLPSSTQDDRSDQPACHFSSIFNPSDRTLDRHHLFSLSSFPPRHSSPIQQPHITRRGSDPTSPLASTSVGATPVLNSRALTSSPQQPAAGTTSLTIDTASTKPSIRYRECLKNHAASGGGHVVDGCGEFMPNGEEGTPEALKCAACECHRNFHRKEVEGELRHVCYCFHGFNPNKIHDLKDGFPSPQFSHHLQAHFIPSTFHQHHKFYHGPPTDPSASLNVPPMTMTFGEGNSAQVESSSEDLNIFQYNGGGQIPVQPTSSKKRFRTKFSQEQKEKMMEFADKLGWRIQKHNEQEVQQFCSQIGVKRHVLKVWMHNNKQAMKK